MIGQKFRQEWRSNWLQAKPSWQEDGVAAFSMAMVTIPLCLGIALASGVPPMAGLFSAIMGGLIATLFRSSQLTMNGPAASLIVVTLSCIELLGDGNALAGFRYFLAATVVAGVFLMLFGLLRLGRYGDIFSRSVIYGVLGAIGLIILGKQMPVALGAESWALTPMESLEEIPELFLRQNPIVGLITLGSVALLVLQAYTKTRWIQMIPGPVWVIGFSMIMAYVLNLDEPHTVEAMGQSFALGPDLLVYLPENIWENVVYPDFSKWDHFYFWQIVVTITLIVSIETVISAKAMDKIDPLGRQTNLNKDLFACGLSSIFSACIGGLPVITAVPMYYGAKTKWANLFQALMLVVFVLFLPVFAKGVPLAALATLLIFTAYKLASPKIFKDTFRLGLEQFVVLISTLLMILFNGLLWGIAFGFAVTIFLQYSQSNLEFKQFWRYLLRPDIQVEERADGQIYVAINGVINFINILQLKNTLRSASKKDLLILDLSNTRLVDSAVLEYLNEEVERYDLPNLNFDIIGLDAHETSSRHPNAMHVLPENKKPQLTKRQQALGELAEAKSGQFWPELSWEVNMLKQFSFFQARPIEYKLNMAKGNYQLFFEWESCDLTFAQGALFNAQAYHSSIILLHLPFNAPLFVLEAEKGPTKIGAQLSVYKDVNFRSHPQFSHHYLLRGPSEKDMREFFDTDLLNFLESQPTHYIESNGTMILIMNQLRFASLQEMREMHNFAEELSKKLMLSWRKQTQAQLKS